MDFMAVSGTGLARAKPGFKPQRPGGRPSDQVKGFRTIPVPLDLRAALGQAPLLLGRGSGGTLQQLQKSDRTTTSGRGASLVYKAGESWAGSRMPPRSGCLFEARSPLGLSCLRGGEGR